MSNSDRPELKALQELEEVLVAVADELASWRRRALEAEAVLEKGDGVISDAAAQRRVSDLENQNGDLRDRSTTARKKVEGLVKRLQFLEDQVAAAGDEK